MRLRKLLAVITGSVDAIIKSLAWVSCVILGLMGLVVAVNVFGRYLFNKPLLGTVELVEVMMVIIAFFTIPYTQLIRRHVRVDVVTSHLSSRIQVIMGSIAFFLSAGIFIVITYQSTLFAIFHAHDLNKATFLFHIPHAFLWCVMVLGCILLCLKLLADIFRPVPPEEEKKGTVS